MFRISRERVLAYSASAEKRKSLGASRFWQGWGEGAVKRDKDLKEDVSEGSILPRGV